MRVNRTHRYGIVKEQIQLVKKYIRSEGQNGVICRKFDIIGDYRK